MKCSHWLVAVTLVWTASGCSAEEGGYVTIRVLLDDRPLEDAQVQLSPKTDLDLGSYSGITGPDGVAEIQPDPRFGKTIQTGAYMVLISKYGPVTDRSGAAPLRERFQNVVPPEYFDPTRTPFRIEVKKGDNRPPPFQLKSSSKP